jgi:hypothetical protein
MTFVLKTMQRAMFDHRIRQMRAAFHAACALFFRSRSWMKSSKKRTSFSAGSMRALPSGRTMVRKLALDVTMAKSSLSAAWRLAPLVRKAFIIVIYHLWERGAQRWVPQARKKQSHSHLVAALTEASIVIDKDGLEELRLLVNCLKHNSEDGMGLNSLVGAPGRQSKRLPSN